MIETIQYVLRWIRDTLHWAPNDVVGVVILALAALVALAVHAFVLRLLNRFVGRQQPYVASVIAGTRGLTRLVFLVVALIVALPVAPFDRDVDVWLGHLLLVAGIGLVGWIAITASHIVAERYLRRFRLDEPDNLLARKHVTQVRVLRRVVDTLLILITVAAALMTFEPVRHYGVSLFASAGVAGLIVGFAARPVLSNLIAGIQLAVTQPIRIEDAVVVENESGRIEEITATYVVVRLWDMRRMIVPLTYFIEKPFQNWTRETAHQIGAVLLSVDFATPVDRVRRKAEEIVRASALWDGNLVQTQVVDADATSMQIRVLATARSSGDAFDLRCLIRENLIAFLQQDLPGALPRQRQQPIPDDGAARDTPPQPT
jgi:small-conductance mechanosensitive channel